MQSDPQSVRLRDSSLKAKLHSQQFVVGTFLEIPSPALVELLGLAGFDFVVVDREHGAIDLKDTEDLVRAGLSTDIRANSQIGPVLNLGPIELRHPTRCAQPVPLAGLRLTRLHFQADA